MYCLAAKNSLECRLFPCGNMSSITISSLTNFNIILDDPTMKKFLLAFALLSSVFAANAAEVPMVEKQTCEKAVYPKSSLMNEETGTVMLSVLVAADGNVLDSKVEQSSGSKTLDKAAVKIYSSCKFKPATKDGKAQQAWAKLEHVWSLS